VGIAKRFYRPELDALRFFAFLAVLVHHGPGATGFVGIVRDMGGFGLSMFFVLSAYLITELLVREREQSGTILWKCFFVRRALRIWPLYFVAIAIGIAFAQMSRTVGAAMIFFVANWVPGDAGRWLAPLWSISIEEQFYLIWPPVIKFGGQALALAVSVVFVIAAGVWLCVFAGNGWKLWYDTPVQFLFFAVGAVLALATRRSPANYMTGGDRVFLASAGLLLLALAASAGIGTADVTGLTRVTLLTGYAGAAVGCASIFRAVLGIRNVGRVLICGGRISYGLYVFHSGMLELSGWLTRPLKLAHFSMLNLVAVDTVALLISIGAAQVSYRLFERPFLLLKERFAVVRSRAV
jgi:peptidoglycan/LPS O-acetylase OafA/YrhL